MAARPLVPSRLAPGGVSAHGPRRAPRSVLGGYVALTKPRIIELLLITTVPTMVLAEQGWPDWGLLLITLLGGSLAAAALLAVFLLPRGAPVEPAPAEDETLATEQWVQQQWGSTAATVLARDQAAEPGADLLDLLDRV